MWKIIEKYMFFVTFITFMFTIFSGCNQLPPTIKNGEFPFHLKYEVKGKVYDVEDAVVCEFKGFDISGGFGKFRTWDEHLKSGTRRISILNDKNVNSVLNSRRVDTEIEVYFDYGMGMYYMGDPNANSAIHAKPHICYVETYNTSPKIKYHDATQALYSGTNG